MSPEAALFLKYRNAEPYDASKEDVYALGVVLFGMLTSNLPYDRPFYLSPDPKSPKHAFVNGSAQHRLLLETLTDVSTGRQFQAQELDDNFGELHSQGVLSLLRKNGYLDYCSPQSLDLLQKIFSRRLSLKELIHHPFVQ